MIIGGSKKEVINNIRKNILNNELNRKVELNDPNLSEEELKNLVDSFYKKQEHKIIYGIKNKIARMITAFFGKKLYQKINIINMEVLNESDLKNGAIITANHFNPLDSYCIRKIAKNLNKRVYILVQATNLAMTKFLGFLMNNMDTIPLLNSPHYILGPLQAKMKEILAQGDLILIYPEEEMWFNYIKPRPTKRGAYQFAFTLDVPVISCFVAQRDLNIPDNDEFNQVSYDVYINKIIFSDKTKSVRHNSIEMAKEDYEAKVSAYEKAYDIKLDYTFSFHDIAGWKER